MNTFPRISPSAAGLLLVSTACLTVAGLSSPATPSDSRPADTASAPVLRTAPGCPMQYYVSLPNGWTPRKKWPVVVTLDGGNKEWRANADTFAAARGNLQFIIVTPLILTNGGMAENSRLPNYQYPDSVWRLVEKVGPAIFDQEGLKAVADDVARRFNGRERYFLTGWSAGAHLMWMMVFMHPEALAGAASACGNFNGRGITSYSTAKERAALPVRGFVGAMDEARFGPGGPKQKVRLMVPMSLVPRQYGLQGEFEYAAKLAKIHGYRNVSLKVMPRRGHEPFAREVLLWFNSIRKK